MPNRSQAADTIETAHAKLLAVSAEWATAKESGQTDVISGLIKRILTEVLAPCLQGVYFPKKSKTLSIQR